jgi:hypothetical protein
MNRNSIFFAIAGILILIIFIGGCTKLIEEKPTETIPEVKEPVVDIKNPLILYFSNYEHHGIGNTAYFFEDGTVVRRSTTHPSVKNPCKIHEGKLPKESLDALKTWLKEISLESVDFGASPSSIFIVLEDNKVKHIFEDAIFYSDFYDKLLFHSLENERILNCEDYDLSSIKNEWNLSRLIVNKDYKITVPKKEIDEIAQKLYGPFDDVYDDLSRQRFCSIPKNEEKCRTGKFNIAYYKDEVYVVLIDGKVYYLFANSQTPNQLLFLDRNLTLTDGTLIDHETIINQAESSEYVYILKLSKKYNTNDYEVYRDI